MPDTSDQGFLPGLLGALQSGMQSPLFQQGLGTYDAGASGRNWAGGLMAGQNYQQQQAKQAQEMAMNRQNMQRGQQQLQMGQMDLNKANAQQRFIQGLDPSNPSFAGLPPGIMALAKGTQDPSVLAGAYKQKMDLDAQMAQAQAMGNIQLQQHIAQLQANNRLEIERIQQTLQMMQNMRQQQQGQPFPQDSNQRAQPGTYNWSPN